MMIRFVFVLFFLSCTVSSLIAQEKKKIEILGADILSKGVVNGENVRKLIGNVKMKQGDVYMDCDSAYFFTDRNAVDAFGHVYIHQGDLQIYSDSLKYNGDERIADLFGNVRLIEPRMELTTKKLTYNLNTKAAKYSDGGHIVSDGTDLVSRIGYYYSESKMAFFRYGVKLVNPNYTLECDTLGYNMDSEISYFFGPTHITTNDSKIYCESGWYNGKTEISSFGKNTILDNPPQILYADSLYYEKKNGYGEAYYHFDWIDTSQKIILSGGKAIFYEQTDSITATEKPLLTYILDGDSLHIAADTLISRKDTVDERELYAFHKVRLFKSDLQGKCDSLVYAFRDSTIRMYREPILWGDDSQMTGDTIYLYMKNNQMDRVELFPNGFIINESFPKLYDQIKGRHIWGYFVNGDLNNMHVAGNAESVYYGKDSRSAYLGINKAQCSEMWIYLKENKVNRIKFYTKPTATFHPMQLVDPETFKLENFNWRYDQRPKSKEDLLKEPEPKPIPVIDANVNSGRKNSKLVPNSTDTTVDENPLPIPNPTPVTNDTTVVPIKP
jgi:lipopolysaccharide export system protein LptA